MSRNYVSLSIIIPAYNEENHIKACLDSIAAQTVRPQEVIVVDNDSSDKTAEIAHSYKFVRVISEKQRGIAFARDAGFDVATSDFLGRIDADTILPTDWVARVQKFYVPSSHRSFALTGGATFRNVPFPRASGQLQKYLAFRLSWLALSHHILWGSNMVLPRKAWDEVKTYVCHAAVIHEDIDLAIHLHRQKVRIVYWPSLRVSAVLKRIYSDHDKLWFNLKWWPRTLRRHGKKRWPITLIAAFMVYALANFTRKFSRENTTPH